MNKTEEILNEINLILDGNIKMIDININNIQDNIKFSSWIAIPSSVCLGFILKYPSLKLDILQHPIANIYFELSAAFCCISILICGIFYFKALSFLSELRSFQNLIHNLKYDATHDLIKASQKSSGNEVADDILLTLFEMELKDNINHGKYLTPENRKKYEEFPPKAPIRLKTLENILYVQIFIAILPFILIIIPLLKNIIIC
jgi:hypothetical protein